MKYTRNFICLLTLLLLPLVASAQVALDSIPAKQLHIISYTKVFGSNYKSWSVQYREFECESKEFVIPITLSFGNTTIDESHLEKKNIKEVDTFSLGLGFDGYEHLGNGLYFKLGLGILTGMESIEKHNETTDEKFLIGLSSNTGFLYVPYADFGLVIGMNVAGKLSNSQALSRSFGFGIELGLNF